MKKSDLQEQRKEQRKKKFKKQIKSPKQVKMNSNILVNIYK